MQQKGKAMNVTVGRSDDVAGQGGRMATDMLNRRRAWS